MGFYWLWNSFLGRDIAYISSCSRTGGVPVGLYGFFKVSQVPGVGCQNLMFLVKG